MSWCLHSSEVFVGIVEGIQTYAILESIDSGSQEEEEEDQKEEK